MLRLVVAAMLGLGSTQALAQVQVPCGVATSEARLPESTTFLSKDNPQVTITYETLAEAIMNLSGTPVKIIKCPGGAADCLMVVKTANGSPDLDICDATGDPDARCIISDEFSLAGMILSMARGRTNADRFHAWFNMLQILRGVTANDAIDSKLLPSWNVRVDFDANNNTTITRVSDDAIDGSARSAIALYTAARSAAFDAGRRAQYLLAANQLAAAILQHDFIHQPYTLRARDVDAILAGSWHQALALCTNAAADKSACDKDAYAGYFGDVVIMLLMAHTATGDDDYLEAARDTLQTYFFAAGFGATIDKLRVPPITWAWWDDPGTAADTLEVICKDHAGFACSDDVWDRDDAPRAASLCKAAYYWRVLGLEPDADLETYCSKWASKGFVRYGEEGTPGYYRRYVVSTGEPADDESTSLYSMAIGGNHNFYCGSDELQRRLFVTFNNHFELSGTPKFGGGPNLYAGAPAIINFGSAIGRDLPSFGAPLNLRAEGGNGSVFVQWDALSGTTQYELSSRIGSDGWQSPILVNGTSHTDSGLDSTKAYLYRVRATRSGVLPSPYGAADLAVPIGFEDASLAGIGIKKNHVEQLRTSVLAIETAAGISGGSFVDTTLTAGSTTVNAIHVSQLRQRLDAALTKLGIAATFSATDVSQGSIIRATDLESLRTDVH